ncbi:MAG: hypothetical protein JST01_12695 [Cyanobacteria bacterium SZAS TMP-1]|nr:hypothetical protein [Cyanobacteria bacterium SZAS TMP-1]
MSGRQTLESLVELERLGFTPQFQSEALPDLAGPLGQAQQAAERVHQALLAGFLPAAEAGQREVVKILSNLDRSALEGEQSIAMAPVVESARLAAILLDEKKPYQAEAALKTALLTCEPDSKIIGPQNRKFIDDLKAQSIELHVENNLGELFDTYSSALTAEADKGPVTKDDLKKAIAQDESSTEQDNEKYSALLQFLDRNYDQLKSHHGLFFWQSGITAGDIQRFAGERSRQINDLKF